MKRILVFVSVLVLVGFILNSSPQVSMSNAAAYDITGVWRLYYDDYCIDSYYFEGDYFKFSGSSTSGAWEYYYLFTRYYESGMTYRVSGANLVMTEYGYDTITGTFVNNNTIEAVYNDGD